MRGSPPTHYHSSSSESSESENNPERNEEEGEVGPRNTMNEDQFARLIREIQAGNAELVTAIAGEGRDERAEEEDNAPFTLKPYGEVLNTTNKRDAELYNQAIKPFEVKYDGSEGTFYNFLNKVKQRAGHLMCNEIYDVEQGGIRMNLFNDYTTINTEQA